MRQALLNLLAQPPLLRSLATDGMVTTLAGNPDLHPGYIDGQGSAAAFSYPMGIAVDASGNLFAADNGNHIIRKVTPEGMVTTVVGVRSTYQTVLGPLPGRVSAVQAVAVDPATQDLLILQEGSILRATF